MSGTSRMRRESHVRICERLGVRLPGPTRHWVGFFKKLTPENFESELQAKIDNDPTGEAEADGRLARDETAAATPQRRSIGGQ